MTMRIPHTISPNTYKVYTPSTQTEELLGEVNRTLRSEDFTWDEKIPPTLVTLCVASLVSNFEEKQVLKELPDEDRCLLLETLSTDLPLNLTVPLLEDGIFWRRSSETRWQSMNDVREYGGSWKTLYLERHLQEYIETLSPAQFVLAEVVNVVQMCAPYVKRLNILQLQPPVIPENTVEGCECPLVLESVDHINLEPVIRELVNLEELHIKFGVENCGMDFSWLLFKFSTKDCVNIGMGIAPAKCLKTFRIHRSTLDDLRVSVLLQHVVKNTTLTKLDFSHCNIGDNGALAIGKLLTEHPTLTQLILCNNKIGALGANGLAFALTQKCSPLELLNLRLNAIGDAGVKDLCSALTKSKYPAELIIAACKCTEAVAIRLGQMLQQNATLRALDVSNNNLGEISGEAFALGLTENKTLLRLDFRMTGITEEHGTIINTALKHNNQLYKREQKELAAAALAKEGLS